MKPLDIQEKIERLQAEKLASEKLMKDYPRRLPEIDHLCFQNSSLCQFSIGHEYTTLEQAKTMIAQWWPYILPLELIQGTFTTFKTEHHKQERGEKNSFPVFPVTVKVSHFGLTFEFYALVNGHLLSVDIKAKFQTYFRQWASVRFQTTYHTSESGREMVHTDKSIIILETPAFVGYKKIKWWASGEYPNDYTLYWDNGVTLDQIFA